MKHKHSRKHKSTFEQLETRQMMSATVIGSASLSAGTLTVNGDATQPTNMVLDYSPDRSQIEVHTGSLNTSFPASQVTNLVINGGSGNDNIFVSNRITLPSQINGGAGDDVIHGGGGNDIIHGGAGNDLIYGGKGQNQIYGDSGNDTLMGQSKNDSLYAGSGNDFLYGGSGNDYLEAGSGNDTMIGGAGNDTLVGGTGTDVELGGSGDDTLTGNTSSTLMGDSGKNTINGVVSTGSDSPTKTGTKVSLSSGNASAADTTATGGDSSSTDTGTTTGITPVSAPVATPVTAPTTPVATAPTTPTTPTAPTTPTTSSVLSAKINVLDGIRQTGLAVNVDALQSSFGTSTALTAKYSWNFGDTGSYGNTLIGWNAAHVYDTAGTYKISLTITAADGSTSTATQSLTIAASTRKMVYVDSVAGSDDNTGSASAPYQSVQAAFANISDNTEILLKAGESFDVTASLHISNSNILVGRYGTGVNPTLNRSLGGGVSTINIWYTSASITIQDVTFDSPYGVQAGQEAPKIGIDGVIAGGSNITVRDCEFLNVDNGVNCQNNPTGILVQNNTAPSATGVRGYFIWGQGSQGVFDGNTVANSTREHNIRMVGMNVVTIENNNLTNLNRQSVDSYDYSKGCIEEHRGTFAYIANNTVTDGDIRVGPLGLWGEPLTTTTENCVIEDNTLNDTVIAVDVGAHHILIDNNVVDNETGAAIVVGGAGDSGRIVDDITITHNTAVTTGVSGQFIEVLGVATNLVLTNNLWVAPNIVPGAYNTAAVYSATADLSDFSNIADNVWPVPTHASKYADGGINLVGVSSTSTGYTTIAAWNAMTPVHNDQSSNVTLADTYEVSLNDILAGSTMKRAA